MDSTLQDVVHRRSLVDFCSHLHCCRLPQSYQLSGVYLTSVWVEDSTRVCLGTQSSCCLRAAPEFKGQPEASPLPHFRQRIVSLCLIAKGSRRAHQLELAVEIKRRRQGSDAPGVLDREPVEAAR